METKKAHLRRDGLVNGWPCVWLQDEGGTRPYTLLPDAHGTSTSKIIYSIVCARNSARIARTSLGDHSATNAWKLRTNSNSQWYELKHKHHIPR